MTLDLTKAILDEALNDTRFDEYEIDFFGGEPFLEFDLIKDTIRYVAETYPKKLLLFTATTNGTLVHGEMKKWLAAHSDIFKCALSLDGTKRMHDINRCGSFDKIDIEFFKKTWPEQEMKMTVSAETLPYLAEGVVFMHENGYKFTVNLAFDIDWSSSENASVLEREMNKLIEYYLSHPDVKPCMLFENQLYLVSAPDPEEGFRQCGAGVEMFSYDVDGKSYPCQFFMPLSIGEERAEKAKDIEFPDEIFRKDFGTECRNCKALRICHTCYGSNYASTGNILTKDMNWCKLQKIIFKANAYFLMQKIKNGTFTCDKETEHFWYKGIRTLLCDFE